MDKRKKSKQHRSIHAFALTVFLFQSIPVHADPQDLPTGGSIVAGSGNIDQSGSAMTVNQSSDKMIADWNTFNIGRDASVHFNQPNSSSVALNRVLSGDASQIFGSLTANGQVFLLNPSGVIFGPTAYVDVGGLVASSLSLTNQDFLNGHYHFLNEGNTGNILNQGQLNAPVVALIAPRVTNEGTIVSPSGNVALAAGDAVSLDFTGDGLLNVDVDTAAVNALVENKNLIRADGGVVVMTARAAGDLMATVVNNEGIIEAKGLSEREGKIILDGGDTGITKNSGTLDVSNENGDGGRIVMAGDKILVDEGAKITASGQNGGEIFVGGGDEGKDPDIRNPKAVYLSSDSLIAADSFKLGNGGKIVVYSKDSTRAYGRLSVRGGDEGGNGGFVETSGGWFDVGDAPDISAPAGEGGTWLIDPYDITVVAGNAVEDIGTTSPFESSGDDASLGVDRVNTALGSGNVIIRTGAGGGQAGDITWDVDYTYAGATARSLTIEAHRDIVLNQTIATSDGALSLALTADSNNDDVGGIIVKENLTTRGGSLTFDGVGTIFSGSVAQTLSTSGGAVDFNGEVLLANTNGLTINTGGGNVGFDSYLDSGNSYALDATGRTWSASKTAVASGDGSSTGHTYLATVTSALEMTAVIQVSDGSQAWLGGSDSSTEGTWRWVSGPEGLENSALGRIFQTSLTTGLTGYNGYNGAFVNWNGGEPNNAGNEDALQLGFGTAGQWNDLPTGSGSLGSIVETNLAASPLTISAGAGTVTFSGAVGTNKALDALSVTASSIGVNGGAVTTEGLQTYTGPVTLGSSSTTLAQTDAATDFTLGSSRTITNATGANASLTIKTTRDIFMNTTSSISSSTGKLNVTLNSDSDATSNGQIELVGGAAINSNGGNITLGGGSNAATYAYGSANSGSLDRGVVISASTLNAAGGDIVVRGHGLNSATTPIGSDITLNSLISTTGAGTITISGVGGTGSTGVTTGINLWNSGAGLTGATIRTENGAINLIGTSGSGSGRNHGIGYDVAKSYIFSTGGGAITLTGTGDVATSRTTTGSLNLGWDGTTTYASDITLNSNTVDLTNSDIRSTGALSIQPTTSSTTIGIAGGAGTLALTAANFSTNFVNGFSGITVGSGIAGAITVGGATTVNDNLTLSSGDGITLNAALNASGQRVTLSGGSGDTVSGSGSITATSLLLNGTNSIYTLNTASANSVGTIATTGAASVNFKNSGSLIVGTVGSTDGVTASGNIRLEANGSSADLTLNKPVTTTSGTINLAAGQNFINNNASNTGIVPGSGRYLVYSTNPSASTEGMTTYNKHYNQTYSSGSNPAYAGSGNWFLYSVAPTLSVSGSSQSITYGDVASTFTPSYSGFIDGDISTIVTGTPAFTIGGATSTSGNYTAGNHDAVYTSGLSNDYGYTIADDASVTNDLIVGQKNLTITEATADDKIYDTTTTAVVHGGTVSPLSGDLVKVVAGTGEFSDPGVGQGKTVTATGFTFSGADGANYAPIQPTGLLADITPVIFDVSSFTSVVNGVNGTTENSNIQNTVNTNAIAAGTGTASMAVTDSLITNTPGGQMSLNTGNSSVPMSLSSSSNTTTMTMSGPAAQPKNEIRSTLAVFSSSGDQVKPEGSFNVTDAGNRLSLNPAGPQLATPPTIQSAGAPQNFSINMPDGVVVELSVSATADGVVLVKILNGDGVLDTQSLVLTGLAAAKEKLGLSSDKVKAVVIERQ